jgi:hypothetical protein
MADVSGDILEAKLNVVKEIENRRKIMGIRKFDH